MNKETDISFDVFISYSSRDQKIVEAMALYLEKRDIHCFVAYRDIPRGKVWAKAITDAIDNSSMMIVAFSDAFNNSDQVDREIELCAEDRKPILTYRMTNTDFTGAKKYYLKNLNWIDAFPNPEDNFEILYEDVCKLVGKTPQSKVSHEELLAEEEWLQKEKEEQSRIEQERLAQEKEQLKKEQEERLRIEHERLRKEKEEQLLIEQARLAQEKEQLKKEQEERLRVESTSKCKFKSNV